MTGWRDKHPSEWTDEECHDAADWSWPLVACQIHGIRQGYQWAVLGWLAARYARDFTTARVADELWRAMEASPQDRHDPWTQRHAADIAARAGRFIERADTADAGWLRQADQHWGISRWLASATRRAQSQPSPSAARMSRRLAMREATRRGR